MSAGASAGDLQQHRTYVP